MTLKQTQFLFTKGEVGPYMEARADTNIYKSGLRKCENWLILPQGGLKRRPGFEFIDFSRASNTKSKPCRCRN